MSTTTVEGPPELAVPDPVLLGALALLREGWTRDSYYRPPSRNPLLRLLGWRARYCLVGALSFAHNGDWLVSPLEGEQAAVERACRLLGFRDSGEAIEWNDCDAEGSREVLERVERAAYGL